MWFSLHPHFLLYNFAEIMYFIITKKKKTTACCQGWSRTQGNRWEGTGEGSSSGSEHGRWEVLIRAHTPVLAASTSARKGRKKRNDPALSSVCRPPPTQTSQSFCPVLAALEAAASRKCVCVWNFPDWCVSFTQSKSLNDFAFNTLPFQFKWGEKPSFVRKLTQNKSS